MSLMVYKARDQTGEKRQQIDTTILVSGFSN